MFYNFFVQIFGNRKQNENNVAFFLIISEISERKHKTSGLFIIFVFSWYASIDNNKNVALLWFFPRF